MSGCCGRCGRCCGSRPDSVGPGSRGSRSWGEISRITATSSPLRIDELKAGTSKDRLAERASDRLKNADMLRAVMDVLVNSY